MPKIKIFQHQFHSSRLQLEKGKIIFLRKPKKEGYHLAGNFRPKILTFYIGKLVDRILEGSGEHLEKHGLIDDNQKCFRKKRCSGRYIYQIIDHHLQLKYNNETATDLFIDQSKASDSLWIDEMLFKSRKAGTRGTKYNVLDDFLQRRYVTSIFGTKSLEPFKSTVGSPKDVSFHQSCSNTILKISLENLWKISMENH